MYNHLYLKIPFILYPLLILTLSLKLTFDTQEARQLKAEGLDHREESQIMGASERVAGDGFSVHRSALSEQQQRQTKTPGGAINQESSRQATKSGITINAQGVCTKQFSTMNASQVRTLRAVHYALCYMMLCHFHPVY